MADYKVTVKKKNEAYIIVNSDEPSILLEIQEKFSFMVDGYKFNPRYKAGWWDGRIRLFNAMRKELPAGLYWELKAFCEKSGYELEDNGEFGDTSVSLAEVEKFITDLKLPFKPREYQIKSFLKCIRRGRLLLLSPTASGKSLIIYLLYRWYNVKTLLIVPSITLVNQMESDFFEYGLEEDVHKIYGGQEKYTEENLTISTWHSISKMSPEYFSQFDMIIGDEAHTSKAKEFSNIMAKSEEAKYRFGTTGTLDDTKVNPMVIQGHFGETYRSTSTHEMMERGEAADLTIKVLVLRYPKEDRKIAKGTYQHEIDWICANEKRNKFIKNLVKSLNGNTLMLFRYVEKHGRVLENILSDLDKPKYWISGATDKDEREEIRKIVNTETDCLLQATEKTCGTGMNIPNLRNLLFLLKQKYKHYKISDVPSEFLM